MLFLLYYINLLYANINDFLEKEIKIFSINANHIFIGLSNSEILVAKSKYEYAKNFESNAWIYFDEDNFRIQFDKNPICYNRTQIVKCLDSSRWKINKKIFGYTIGDGINCMTINNNTEVEMKICTQSNNQLFDFKLSSDNENGNLFNNNNNNEDISKQSNMSIDLNDNINNKNKISSNLIDSENFNDLPTVQNDILDNLYHENSEVSNFDRNMHLNNLSNENLENLNIDKNQYLNNLINARNRYLMNVKQNAIRNYLLRDVINHVISDKEHEHLNKLIEIENNHIMDIEDDATNKNNLITSDNDLLLNYKSNDSLNDYNNNVSNYIKEDPDMNILTNDKNIQHPSALECKIASKNIKNCYSLDNPICSDYLTTLRNCRIFDSDDHYHFNSLSDIFPNLSKENIDSSSPKKVVKKIKVIKDNKKPVIKTKKVPVKVNIETRRKIKPKYMNKYKLQNNHINNYEDLFEISDYQKRGTDSTYSYVKKYRPKDASQKFSKISNSIDIPYMKSQHNYSDLSKNIYKKWDYNKFSDIDYPHNSITDKDSYDYVFNNSSKIFNKEHNKKPSNFNNLSKKNKLNKKKYFNNKSNLDKQNKSKQNSKFKKNDKFDKNNKVDNDRKIDNNDN